MPKQSLPRFNPASTRQRWDARQLSVVLNSVVASAAGAYVITQSTAVTLVAALLAVLLTGWLAALDR